jgi:hypothetical protein
MTRANHDTFKNDHRFRAERYCVVCDKPATWYVRLVSADRAEPMCAFHKGRAAMDNGPLISTEKMQGRYDR